MQPEQLTFGRTHHAPAAETVSPPPASPPPFHEKYLPEILRHEDGSATWEALTKFLPTTRRNICGSAICACGLARSASVPGQRWDHHRFSWFPDQFHVWEGNYLNPYRYYPP